MTVAGLITAPPGTRMLIMVGLPGCGKTLRARNWVSRDRAHRARVCRDDLRITLFGVSYTGTTPVMEDVVTTVERMQVTTLLALGVSVVVDATHLKIKYREAWRELAATLGVTPEIVDMTRVPVDTCIHRDAQRYGWSRVGAEVIRRMWEAHEPLEPEELTIASTVAAP